MRLYAAICSLIEAGAAYLNTATLESEMDAMDWANAENEE